MNTKETFLLFTIGPVQEFIAAARKTKDLFAGSLMLSHLAGRAIETVINGGGQLVFPAITRTPIPRSQIASIPNRFLAKVPATRGEDIAEQAKREVMKEFSTIADAAKKEFRLNGDPLWEMFWKEQTTKFLECYWVTQAIDPSISYGDHYRAIEQFSGNRKLLRQFEELNFDGGKGQPGHKCTLVLNLSAVHTENMNAKVFWQKQGEDNPGEYRRNERLSAIALAKRKFLDYVQSEGSFPSTTTIAAGSFYRSIIEAYDLDTDLEQSIGTYARKLRELMPRLKFAQEVSNFPSLERSAKEGPLLKFLKIDADWLDEGMYDEKYLAREFGVTITGPVSGALKAARTAHQELFHSVGKHRRLDLKPSLAPIAKYYALFFFDGDEMGKWLSGSKENKQKDRFPISEEVHTQISNSLRQFSAPGNSELRTVEGIVEGQDVSGKPRLGKLIYSGGDDVIAFASLEDTLDILLDLRRDFGEAMAKATSNFAPATASVGVAIAHHQMNLQQVLQEARRTEEFAKETLSRDALAITLLKRSGEHSITGAKWFLTNGRVGTIDLMKKFSGLVHSKVISTKFVHDLKDEQIGLSVFEVAPNRNATPIITEIKRLLGRHTKQEEASKTSVDDLAQMIERYYGQLVMMAPKRSQQTEIAWSSLEQLTELLMVAQFIGQGGA